MSAYFQKFHERLAAIDLVLDDVGAEMQMAKIEEELVRDVFICARLVLSPLFQREVATICTKYGVYTSPNRDAEKYESAEDCHRSLKKLVFHLQTTFQSIAKSPATTCSDDPTDFLNDAHQEFAQMQKDWANGSTPAIWNSRAETGGMQFGKDWDGVFIRGDNMMGIYLEIQTIKHLIGDDESFASQRLDSLLPRLGGNGIQRMKPFEQCFVEISGD